MNAELIRPDGTSRQVKNLGWLRRHWKDVEGFRLVRLTQKRREYPQWEGLMVAYLKGTVPFCEYRVLWANSELMLSWLDRPIFRGLPVMLVAPQEELRTPVYLRVGEDDRWGMMSARR